MTGDAMVGGRPLAGVGRRAAALLVDTLAALPMLAVVLVVFGEDRTTVRTTAAGTVTTYGRYVGTGGVLVLVAVWLLYATATEWRFGATLGKRAVGLRVVRGDGSPPSLRAAAVRNALRLVDGILFYLVGAILAWSSPLRQRLGDRAAGTVVVHWDA